jgi:hypothetical protein
MHIALKLLLLSFWVSLVILYMVALHPASSSSCGLRFLPVYLRLDFSHPGCQRPDQCRPLVDESRVWIADSLAVRNLRVWEYLDA